MAGYLKPKFVMTPELEALRARGRDYEPWVQEQDDTAPYTSTKPPQHLLDTLPALDDIPGMAWYLGLDGTMSTWVLRKYQDKHDAANPLHPHEIRPAPDDSSKQIHRFPIISRLLDIYFGREAGDEGDPDEGYESYIRGGLSQGLRPEYAIFCGLHESEPRWSESYADYFYTKSYQEHADEVVRGQWAAFGLLWRYKLASGQDTSPEGFESEKEVVSSVGRELDNESHNTPAA
ncbi:hypothetical protein KJ359_012951 [Pestalotiopsis sp. 9143b]|nr:hypothetical protein KJ359_012951 [Pestalotiopsis sp. 9143b]